MPVKYPFKYKKWVYIAQHPVRDVLKIGSSSYPFTRAYNQDRILVVDGSKAVGKERK